MSASAAPAAMAGLASGNATRRNAAKGEAPSIRAASSASTDWLMKACRAVR
jgi:hypothetical protein